MLERLVEYILRNYPGIFVQYAYIDEEILAGKLGVKRQQVYESLLLLPVAGSSVIFPVTTGLISFITSPGFRLITALSVPRPMRTGNKLMLIKVGHMAGYIELTDSCRQLYLMAYFGQREKEACGICDLCLEQKKRPGNTNRKTEEKILELRNKKIMRSGN